jgi:hypothetical protein
MHASVLTTQLRRLHQSGMLKSYNLHEVPEFTRAIYLVLLILREPGPMEEARESMPRDI